MKSENSQLPEGYKQTDVGVIPEDWFLNSIIRCADYVDYRGKTPTKTETGRFLVTAKNIRDGYIDYENSKEYIAEDNYEKAMSRGKPKIGDVLITTEAPLGNVAVIDREDIALAQRVIKYRAKESVIYPDYLKHYFLSAIFRKILDENSSGSTAQGIKGSVLHQLTVILPPLPEQQAIAEVLSDVDALITSLDLLLGKKRNIKQGTMQLLLTGKKRLPNFSGDWETKTLGEIGEFKKGKGIKKDSVLSDGLPCIRYGEIYTYHNEYIKRFNSFISNETAKESQKIKLGDLLFAGSGETAEEIGKCVAYLGNEEVYAGGDIIILSPSKCDSSFLGFLMNHEIIVKQKSQMAQGDAVVHIYSSSMKNINVPLPPTIEEQKAIAQILSDMDAEIEALEAKRDKYKAIKQGMMQELLTGKIRLV